MKDSETSTMPGMDDVQIDEVTVKASDGWPLAATVYRGADPKVAVLISAGTGFPRRFYRHVAQHLAARGAVVLTYDFRGIGGSVVGELNGSAIDYPDWGQLDMPAAMDHLAALAPGLPLTTLGHSIGGQFVGFMPDQSRIARHAFVSVGSGYWGVHHRSRIPLELFFWWGFGAAHLLRHGFIKGGGLWPGESLPPQVFKTWRRWSQRRGYLQPDLQSGRYSHSFDQVQAPIRAWVFPDDGIATPKACADTLSHYPNAPSQIHIRSAKDLGVRRIGHEGAFRKGQIALWDELFAWLAEGQG